MVRFSLAAFILLLAAAGVSEAATARSMYLAALGRERAVREALKELPPAPVEAANGGSILREVRVVVNAYEAIVRRYPASGYTDDALWQAGRLSLDAFARFAQPQDRSAGIRLLHRLATGYPASKLAKRVPAALEGFDTFAPNAPPAGASQAGPASTAATAGTSSTTVAHRATLREVRRAVLPDVVRVTMELDSEVPFHEERLENPARVFLDLTATRAAPSLLDQTIRFDTDSDVVRQVRIGRHPNNITRVVLDAAGVSGYSVYILYNPYRLVVDCVRATGTTVSQQEAPVPLLRARRADNDWGRRLPARTRGASALIAAAQPAPLLAAAPADGALAGAAPPPVAATGAPPPSAPTGGFSMARQLGLSVSRIVIDPGHGGHDSGARGKGVTEAELVLDVALRLEALLQKVPGTEVFLTRRTDEFIPLPERTAIANREGADLFLSIHANASPNGQAHGVETYFLNFANNLGAAAVAARENAASGRAMGSLPDLVKVIALNNKLDESRDFAAQVQRAMIDRLRGANKNVKDLGVKQAPFVVLIGAAMPSVLAEVSFVTNPQEARLLRGTAYRQRIAEALLAAIRRYQTSLKNAVAVAQQ
jgi:N-acetylmuramoyl-L-alanine amidase